MAKYTKLDLVAAAALHVDIETKAEATRIIDFIFDTIKEQVILGNDVALPSIGTIVTVDRAARTATVPGTDRKVEVPAKKAVKVNITAPLKAAVN